MLSRLLRLVLVGFIILIVGPSEAWARDCREEFANLEKSRPLVQRKDHYSGEAAKFFAKNKRLPSELELAKALKIPVEELKRFFAMKSTPSDVAELVAMGRDRNPSSLDSLRKDVAKVIAQSLRDKLGVPSAAEIAEALAIEDFETFANLMAFDLQLPVALAQKHYPSYIEQARNKLAGAFAKAAAEFGVTPSLDVMAQTLGIEEWRLSAMIDEKTGLFPNRNAIKELARTRHPAAFDRFLDTDIFDSARQERLYEALTTRQRLIVTTAVSGAPVNAEFFKSCKLYAQANNAAIVVIPANMITNHLDASLLEDPDVHVLTSTAELNQFLAVIADYKVTAKQMNPLMGLEDKGPRGQSLIVGSPKMFSKTVATMDNEIYPHRLFTTGAITDPNYAGKKFISQRTDWLAAKDHVIGGLVLERNQGQNNFLDMAGHGMFNARHIEFIPEKNGFMDVHSFYGSDGQIERKRAGALIMGDLHVGHTDQVVLESVRKRIRDLKPEFVVIHDIFNGHSISHHERGRVMSLAEKAKNGDLLLEEELNGVASMVNAILASDPDIKVVIVPSNHDMWLHRWLQDGQYNEEPQNTDIGLELALVMRRKEDPLKHALLNPGVRFPNDRDHDVRPARVDYPNRVIFLDHGASFKIGPTNRRVELGLHGHAGASGARATVKSMRRAADRMVYGHTHTSERQNGVVNVGTLTRLSLPYNRDGVSSWVHSMALVGENGEIQVLEYLDTQWYQDADYSALSDDVFFPPNYPIVRPAKEYGSDEGQVDQWSEH
ncbi:MAG: hypothetical protein COV44_03730 [Deltaproteobacteria bacterium CG11_big_fil_rev_8_21_14_0_20_45_16]|nr:MAG: hypothetical protein COV44_03730 [Deltaproteobacteria bacterium CG11_big_fil_rev_8_21_14_0_20_45_16]